MPDTPHPYTEEELQEVGKLSETFGDNISPAGVVVRLLATIDQLKQENAKWKGAYNGLSKSRYRDHAILKNERDRYKQALEWYADAKNWSCRDGAPYDEWMDYFNPPVKDDEGDIARAALCHYQKDV